MLFGLSAAVATGVGYAGSWGGALFDCEASGYSDDAFMGYCSNPAIGDYEHAAYWRGLEPRAVAALRRAEIVTLGDSKSQYAFSSDTMLAYLRGTGRPFYILGFGYGEPGAFPPRLLEKVGAKPKLVIINADPFFLDDLSVAAEEAIHPTLRMRVGDWIKKWAQPAHRWLCETLGACSFRYPDLFRSRSTGAWSWTSILANVHRVAFPPEVKPFSPELAEGIGVRAKAMLKPLGLPPGCVILTEVPDPARGFRAMVEAIHRATGAPVVTVRPAGLLATDEEHMAKESAERWAAAFVAKVRPYVDACLGGSEAGG